MNKKQIKYNVSYFQEKKSGVENFQNCFDDYDEAIEFAHQVARCSNIKSVCFETLLIAYTETSVIKD